MHRYCQIVSIICCCGLAPSLGRADPTHRLLSKQHAELQSAVATVEKKIATEELRKEKILSALARRARKKQSIGTHQGERRFERLWVRAAARFVMSRGETETSHYHNELQHLKQTRERFDHALQQKEDPTISLVKPVSQAPVVRAFGTLRRDDRKKVSRHGIDFRSISGSNVVAPLSGEVVYVGTISGLGSGVVIQANDVVVLLSGIQVVSISVGTSIEKGSSLGQSLGSSVHLELRARVGEIWVPRDPTTYF